MYYHAYMIMHVKDPPLSVVILGYRIPLVGFYLSLDSLHVLSRDVNMTQTNRHSAIRLYMYMYISSVSDTELIMNTSLLLIDMYMYHVSFVVES